MRDIDDDRWTSTHPAPLLAFTYPILVAVLHSLYLAPPPHCYVVRLVSRPTVLGHAFLLFLLCMLALSVPGNRLHHYVVRTVSGPTMHSQHSPSSFHASPAYRTHSLLAVLKALTAEYIFIFLLVLTTSKPDILSLRVQGLPITQLQQVMGPAPVA